MKSLLAMISSIADNHLISKFVLWGKRLIYWRRGEPYRMNGQTLRYMPGSRPVRLKYKDSPNPVNRYDALQIEALASNVQQGDTVIDIGAHAGQYSVLMAALCGSTGHVISFEPDPYARQRLLKNIALNAELNQPKVEAIALSDTDGKAILYSRGGNSQSSLARSGVEFTEEHRVEEIRVSVMKLDTYLNRKNTSVPSWVKIDVEGAEINVLKGAKTLLDGPTQILCELHPYAWAEFETNFYELKGLVSRSGRRMCYLDSERPVSEEAKYGTVILEKA